VMMMHSKRQYFERFSGEPMARVDGGIVDTSRFVLVGGDNAGNELIVVRGSSVPPSSTFPRAWRDDDGNPPPPYLQGDIIPEWHYGRWWICNEDLVKAQKAHGDKE